MIERKSVINLIEIARDGTVGVRIALMLVEDGKVLSNNWHRTLIGPEDNVKIQMAHVNAHLVQMGEAEVSKDEVSRLEFLHKQAQAVV